MSPKYDRMRLVTSWTNGRKAIVHLREDEYGHKVIHKVYRRGYRVPMFREYAMAAYVSSRSTISPRVLMFRPLRNELFFQYLPGQRVFEWVLSRFCHGLNMAEFQSFDRLSPPDNVDPRVAHAFELFRRSRSAEVLELREALRVSYRELHGLGMKHGSADPRNVIYHQGHVFIIDFDNARPSLNAAESDYEELEYWYGLT